MNEVLKVFVKIETIVSIEGHTGTVNMITFSGYAKSPYFHGMILPSAVDFQEKRNKSFLHLSARYLLEGIDDTGSPCRICIENNGLSDETGHIHTTPTIYTDSKSLQWLESAKLIGYISNEKEMVVIHFMLASD